MTARALRPSSVKLGLGNDEGLLVYKHFGNNIIFKENGCTDRTNAKNYCDCKCTSERLFER